ncbi:hypothetical protein CGCF415_v014864 [Colletotrichum fructicola]|nr:hypothetical protein CGCF415_v014864 [Colletotrichum fructicola]KAF4935063.1 hypothetical protein CGCF245_v008077 [Colletotrichum fructicola]KAF5490571.1 hypothetical protein CGCF413_v010651 [Colletotrichum fructicola]
MATPRRRALQTPNATSPGPTLDSITVAGDGSSSPETPTSDDLPDATVGTPNRSRPEASASASASSARPNRTPGPTPRPFAAETSNRKNNNRSTLDLLWGRNNWNPPPSITGPKPKDQLGVRDTSILCSISNLAVENNVDLPCLYRPGGVIYDAAAALHNPIQWSSKVLSEAYKRLREQYPDTILKRKKHPNVSRLSLSSNPGPQGTPTPLHLTAETQPIVNSQAPVESPGELMPQPTVRRARSLEAASSLARMLEQRTENIAQAALHFHDRDLAGLTDLQRRCLVQLEGNLPLTIDSMRHLAKCVERRVDHPDAFCADFSYMPGDVDGAIPEALPDGCVDSGTDVLLLPIHHKADDSWSLAICNSESGILECYSPKSSQDRLQSLRDILLPWLDAFFPHADIDMHVLEGTSCEHPADSGVYVLLAIENLMRDSQSWGLFAQLEEPAENLRKVLRQYLSDLTIDARKPKHRQSDGPGPRPTTKRPNSLVAPEQPAAKRPCLARPMDHRARVSASASPARSRESLERVKFMIRQAKVTYQEQFPCLADLQTSVGALEAKLSDFKLEASKWQAASDAKEYIFKEAQSKQESANHDLLDAQQKLDEVLAVAATLEKTPGASTSKSIANILDITRKEVQTCQDDRELAKTRLNDLSNEINEAKEAYWQAQEKLSSAEQDVLTTKDSLDDVAQALQLGKYLEEFTG